jgi:hypothetical protein
LYNQQVPRIREIKTYTHRALESGRRELYVRLGGMCEEFTATVGESNCHDLRLGFMSREVIHCCF